MQRLAHAVILMEGWRRSGVALLAGALCALAMPPLFVFPAFLIGLPLAVWLLDGSEAGRSRLAIRALWSAFRIGWWFGFGYFLAGLWWLGAAFLVESDEFLWALPLGVVGLPAVLALFHAAGFALARMLWSGSGRRIFALAAGLGAAEYARTVLFTGFPWNSFGQVFSSSLASLQFASLVPLEGLTVLALLIGAACATLGTGRTAGARWLMPLLAAVGFMGILAFGFARLEANGGFSAQPTAENTVPNVSLRIVQPNVAQREKNQPGMAEPILRRYLELSDRATSPSAMGLGSVTHLIWPESPFSFVLAEEPSALRLIGDSLPAGTTLITGAVRLDQSGTDGRRRFYNALQIVSTDGVITGSYDKVHLVPFGEYLPFAEWLTRLGLRQFITTPGGFEAGTRLDVMQAAGLPPFLPLICYEAIFPAALRGLTSRPQLLINVTNDAWFGTTFGPYQHLEQARMRAVEAGIPLVRSANTGISALIDPFGRPLGTIALGLEGVIDGPLPAALNVPFASRTGQWSGLVLLLLCLTLCLFHARVEKTLK